MDTTDQALRLPEVMKITALRRSNVYKLMALGKFPKSFKITERSCAWLKSEVEEWLQQRIAKRDEVA